MPAGGNDSDRMSETMLAEGCTGGPSPSTDRRGATIGLIGRRPAPRMAPTQSLVSGAHAEGMQIGRRVSDTIRALGALAGRFPQRRMYSCEGDSA